MHVHWTHIYFRGIFTKLQKLFPDYCGRALKEYKRAQNQRGGLGGGIFRLVSYGAQDLFLTGGI